MEEINEIFSEITVINKTENRFQGAFKLYAVTESERQFSINIVQKTETELHSYLSIRVQKEKDLNSSIRIVYPDVSDMSGYILAIAKTELPSFIEVPIHNRFQGSFTLLSAPVKTVALSTISDAMTRSREDLRSINYGDLRTMLIGKGIDESYQSFLQFEDLDKSIPDLNIVKKAKLRLYYSGTLANTNIQLSQPNTIWREMGITDLNKPHSVETLKNNDYILNSIEKYIEFDFFDVVKRWQNKELENYGLILNTEDNQFYTFFTRESNKPPKLIIEYITTEVYSSGRSDKEATIFIYGKGNKDVSATINVHSDINFSYRAATIYVHRYEDPVDDVVDTTIAVTNPSLSSTMLIKIKKESEREATIRVTSQTTTWYESTISINRPDLWGSINIYNNSFLSSFIAIRSEIRKLYDSQITVSRPDMASFIEVSIYKKKYEEFNSFISVRGEKQYDDVESTVLINRPDTEGIIKVRGIKDSDLTSSIDVIQNVSCDCYITVNRPDLSSFITIKEFSEISSTIYVKHQKDAQATIDIRQVTELNSIINIKRFIELLGTISVNRPDLNSIISVRVQGEKDLESVMMVKKRFVSDMSSIITVSGGSRNRNVIIMF